jgi:hypothetical protein
MATMMRRRARSYAVYAAEGRKVIDRTTLEHAEWMEKRGIWRRVYNTMTGELEAFRIDGADTQRVDQDQRHIETTPTFSETEMERVAGCHGKSRTMRMREADRQDRAKHHELPEDEIERTIAKLRVYPLVGAAQGDILKAWPK